MWISSLSKVFLELIGLELASEFCDAPKKISRSRFVFCENKICFTNYGPLRVGNDPLKSQDKRRRRKKV